MPGWDPGPCAPPTRMMRKRQENWRGFCSASGHLLPHIAAGSSACRPGALIGAIAHRGGSGRVLRRRKQATRACRHVHARRRGPWALPARPVGSRSGVRAGVFVGALVVCGLVLGAAATRAASRLRSQQGCLDRVAPCPGRRLPVGLRWVRKPWWRASDVNAGRHAPSILRPRAAEWPTPSLVILEPTRKSTERGHAGGHRDGRDRSPAPNCTRRGDARKPLGARASWDSRYFLGIPRVMIGTGLSWQRLRRSGAHPRSVEERLSFWARRRRHLAGRRRLAGY
ncbi:hypothetical protein C2E23DRAFT_842292 [Lenzites betulinus]|nr:hypothetical protein C2E23DRAFT_842292 [Lenzites betulinus]